MGPNSVRSESRGLWICFPVWREWKLEYRANMRYANNPFGYAFPFEGNGNKTVIIRIAVRFKFLWICFPVWREWKHSLQKLRRPPDVLWICFPVWREWKPRAKGEQLIPLSDFGYAFPFEGNGNSWLIHLPRTDAVPILWICFPVWREWKPKTVYSPAFAFSSFGYAFPFEGNGN